LAGEAGVADEAGGVSADDDAGEEVADDGDRRRRWVMMPRT
jgi:hypothetical protein